MRSSKVVLGFLLLAVPAAAHLQPIVGKIVDLVQQSDIVVIGVVQPAGDAQAELIDVTVAAPLLGKVEGPSLQLRCKARLPVGERQVVFIGRTPDGLRCVQPSGAHFPAETADDPDYTRVVRQLADALRLPAAKQVPALRAALIPALRANSRELRYHAALELVALSHPGHELSPQERKDIESISAETETDPALRPFLDRLLRRPP